ncbi:hypothetical protein PYW07_005934 [Mythimna separata]|uniref:Uncharacterized protein n=1 Tax=Mythimna separata TaxID=271217 RepID=A0AAD8DRE2_MYTSE|nr:hypothetical protein PYW07_005934 [Mythimna separata]
MKVLALLSLCLAVASSYPVVKTWTLSQLSSAIELKQAEPGMMPYLEDALNEIMYSLFTGKNEKFVHAVVPSPSGGPTWTIPELTAAIHNPETKQEYMPALLQAYSFVGLQNQTGELLETVQVAIPALDISTWTQADLNEALKSPATKAALMPYLEKAHKELMEALEKGETRETIHIVTPVGLIPPKGDYEYLIKPLKNLIKKTKKGL